MSFVLGASEITSSYSRPGLPVSGPCTVWQKGVFDEPAEREPEQPGVVVEDVVLVRASDRVDEVLHLPVRVADPLARRGLEH